MSSIIDLYRNGYSLETIVSKKPGFEIYTFVNALGERVALWLRSSKITMRSIEEFKKILTIKCDKLIIEFTEKPEIDKEAEEELRKMFKEVTIRSRKTGAITTESKIEKIELYGGDVVIVKNKHTRGSLRLFEYDRVYQVMDKLGNDKLWLLIIDVTKDGKIIISDDYKSTVECWKELVQKGHKVVILAIWHGQYSTDIFLIYPELKQ